MATTFMRVLADSPHFLLGHEWENVILVDKLTGNGKSIGSHYGDPKIGLISPDEAWFVTGGEGVLCHRLAQGSFSFLRDGPDNTYFVHSMRFEGPLVLRVLIDPWSNKASVWQIDLATTTIRKLHDGPFIEGACEENVPF